MARLPEPSVGPASSTLLLGRNPSPRRRRGRGQVLLAAAVAGVLLGGAAQLTFAPSSRRAAPPPARTGAPLDQTRLARVSYDGDTRSDVAVQTLGVPGRLLVFHAGRDRFDPPRAWSTVPGTINGVRPSRLNGDFDGDGRTDAATIATDGSRAEVSVLLSDGSAFRSPQVWGAIEGLGGPEDVFASGDFDGDGRSDLAVAHSGEGDQGVDIEVLRSRGSAFASATTWASNLPWDRDYLRLIPGDFDDDGSADLLDAGPAPGGGVELRVLVSRGTRFGGVELWRTLPDVRWQDIKLLPGDFDGDGRGDIATAAQAGADTLLLTVFRASGAGFDTGEEWFRREGWGVHSSWLTSGDYDGDGTTDIARIADAGPDAGGGGIALSVALSDGHRFRPDRVWGQDPDVSRSEMFTLGRLG